MSGTLVNAFPAQRVHCTQVITVAEASKRLSAFLHAADTDAALHPTAKFKVKRVVAGDQGLQGLTRGHVLHNLRRVQAGLAGKDLAAEPVVVNLQRTEKGSKATKATRVGDSQAQSTDLSEDAARADVMEEGWQDKEDFDKEQSLERGDVDDQITMRAQEPGEANTVPTVQATKSSGDKEARRQRKKEKRKMEQKERAEKVQREKAMAD